MFRLKLKDYLFKSSGNVPNIKKNLFNRRQRDIWSPSKICVIIVDQLISSLTTGLAQQQVL